MTRVAYFQIPASRLVIAQVLAGVTLALVLTNIIAGPHVMVGALAAAFGTTAIIAGLIGTSILLVLSAAAFVLSLKQRSFLVAGLLVASGVIFLISPMTATAPMTGMEGSSGGHMSSASAGAIHVGSYGLAILGLGVAKGIGAARTATKRSKIAS
jgi:hypothetical protein